jgi:hypothetical protein
MRENWGLKGMGLDGWRGGIIDEIKFWEETFECFVVCGAFGKKTIVNVNLDYEEDF